MGVPFGNAQPPPIRILPLGDSITYGQNVAGGYRLPLYTALTNAGYNVDYVGTRTDNGATGLPDANHQGQPGWKISDVWSGLYENIIDWLYAVKDPDVVLLHIGTNDSGGGTLFTNAVDRLDNLVTRIATNRPCAHIIVTTLLPRKDANYIPITNYFNPYVEGKVAGQQALGRKVHFLDMAAYVTTNDLSDSVHPNAAGYGKMAAAWFTAITNVIGAYGDTNAPALARAVNLPSLQGIDVVFSKPVDRATATNTANYAVSGGVAVSGATLSADLRTVTLATAPLTRDAVYTLTVNNIRDLSTPTPLTIAAGSADAFKATVRGYLNNVPESSGYQLAYTFNIPNAAGYGGSLVPYATDNSVALNGPLARVAYYLELQTLNGDLKYLWVSMDAFTNDVTRIAVPVYYNRTTFQKYVYNMNVVCNAEEVTPGTGLTGNIEFWPSNYDNDNTAGFPGASNDLYDYGDNAFSTSTGYGSMQVHSITGRQTLFAFNNWGGGGATPDLGIGNKPTGNPDWTFSNNAGEYPIRTLSVLVTLSDNDATPPTLASAQAGCAGTLIAVTFSEPLAADSVDGSHFVLDNGVSVISTALLPDLRTVNLITTPQPADAPLTLTVTGVRDGAAGNPIAPGSAIAVTPASVLPPEITANVGALADGYRLVYTLDIPAYGAFNGTSDPYRFNQSLATGAFDRVAYYLELVTASITTQYVWTAMDAFTPYLKQIGVPTSASKAVFQQYVSNLVVKSNVSGVSNGTFETGGNLEFWPNDYSQGNALGIPNANGGTYDFGDTRSTGGGHGSMQVHNCVAKQTLFAMNNWGTDGQAIALGIGNRGSGDPDWTFAANAGTSYARRTLHVLARPAAPSTAGLPAEIAANVPAAKGYQLVCSITNIPIQTRFQDATNYYTYDRRAYIGAGSFSRVAYYMELQSGTDAVPRYVWTAMDAFTTDATRLGVPVNGVMYQQKVNRLDVFSNVGGIITGNGLTTGSIEFWPSSYSTANSIYIPYASDATYDFGDGGASSSGGGYGSMQVHNHGSNAKQTLFAMNNFNTTNAGNTVCLGIGNQPAGSPDWTHAQNAAAYDLRRVLHVLVLPGGEPNPDLTAPTLGAATGAQSLDKVTLFFSETVADSAATASFYTLNNGVAVLGARLLPTKRGVILTTSPQTAGQSYTVSVTGVRDRSSNANPVAPGSSVSFIAPGTERPEVLANVPEAEGYALIHQLAFGNTVNYAYGCNYAVDESLYQTQTFDRVAYFLELAGTNGISKWVYVSMNAFTPELCKIGVPTANRLAMFQQYVSNLNVYAYASDGNVAVTTGVGIAAGNIEFWSGNYGQSNDKSIPGASAATFDFGDGGAGMGVGHGSMQIHNFAAGHTILSVTHCGNNNTVPALGIGNNPMGSNSDPDWTFTYNAPAFSTKNLYVLAHWGETPAGLLTGSLPAIYINPKSLTIRSGQSAGFYVRAKGASAYQWRRNGVWIQGATGSSLDLNPAGVDDAGTYDVLVYGSGTAYLTSESALLTVRPLGTVFWLK